jgi:hypothetical protein
MPGFAVYHIGIHATKGAQAQSADGEEGPEDDAYGSESADSVQAQDPGAAVLRADDNFDEE